jgi:hypothetical protein
LLLRWRSLSNLDNCLILFSLCIPEIQMTIIKWDLTINLTMRWGCSYAIVPASHQMDGAIWADQKWSPGVTSHWQMGTGWEQRQRQRVVVQSIEWGTRFPSFCGVKASTHKLWMWMGIEGYSNSYSSAIGHSIYWSGDKINLGRYNGQSIMPCGFLLCCVPFFNYYPYPKISLPS